jgi:hypothetical protein
MGGSVVKRQLLLLLGLVGLLSALLVGPAGATEATAGPSISPVTSTDGSQTGYSTLVRTSPGVRFTLFTTQLQVGHAITVWWVVFNHPENCAGTTTSTSPRCSMADMANPDVDASALRADGDVVGPLGIGWFSGSLAVDDATEAIVGTGLHNPAGADIHFVVRDHGPVSPDPDVAYQQTHTVDVCNPTCTNVQTSVHEAS